MANNGFKHQFDRPPLLPREYAMCIVKPNIIFVVETWLAQKYWSYSDQNDPICDHRLTIYLHGTGWYKYSDVGCIGRSYHASLSATAGHGWHWSKPTRWAQAARRAETAKACGDVNGCWNHFQTCFLDLNKLRWFSWFMLILGEMISIFDSCTKRDHPRIGSANMSHHGGSEALLSRVWGMVFMGVWCGKVWNVFDHGSNNNNTMDVTDLVNNS